MPSGNVRKSTLALAVTAGALCVGLAYTCRTLGLYRRRTKRNNSTCREDNTADEDHASFIEDNISSKASSISSKEVTLQSPPMLWSLPLVGSLPFLPDFPGFREYFTSKSQTLGPVIGFYMGRQYTVMLNGTEAIRDALEGRPDISCRPTSFTKSTYFNRGYKGLAEHLYDEEFKKYHQLTLKILKEFGYGKRIMEERIRREVDAVVHRFRQFEGQSFDPDEITSGVFNVISSILFNKRYEVGDADLKEILRCNENFFAEFFDFMPVDAFPALLYLPKFKKKLDVSITHKDEMLAWVSRAILDAAYRSNEGENFVTSFLEKDEKKGFDYGQLAYLVRDLILAGTDTSAAIALWFMVYMANYPDVQAKVQKEIDAVVGNDREVAIDDEKSLPYTQATLLELMRRQTIAALNPHCAVRDTRVLNYRIPERTMVIVNLYSAHMDPKSWEKPEEFLPERFLDESGNVTGKKRMIGFSLGKRQCVGEHLARQEVFLFCSSLAHRFNILPPDGQDKIRVKERVSLTTTPTPFQARLVPRMAVG